MAITRETGDWQVTARGRIPPLLILKEGAALPPGPKELGFRAVNIDEGFCMAMIVSALYIFLTGLGLGFLIFIHELGHYYMGKKVGMKVEVFSIGFGKPLFVWYRDSVRWQLCLIPFGGYVKFAGEQKEGNVEPYEIPDGFYGKSPLARIQVAFMGPFVNLCFAVLAFSVLWFMGGRDKPFEELTSHIGWVDPDSELYALGLRPGDQITSYDGHLFQSSKDHFYAAMVGDGAIDVKGSKVNFQTREFDPFEYNVSPYQHPYAIDEGILTLGVLNPARYLIYDRYLDGSENPLMDGVPMAKSGIEYGDRVVWVDGEKVFSIRHFGHLINDGRTFLTVKRGGERLQLRVPRVRIKELHLESSVKDELEDWQYESRLKGRLADLFFLPYDVTLNCVVQSSVKFIDEEEEGAAFPKVTFSSSDSPLKPGDQIVAVDGQPVVKAYDLLRALQEKKLHIIVQRGQNFRASLDSEQADEAFVHFVDWQGVDAIASSIGSGYTLASSGDFHLLNPVSPIKRKDLPHAPEKKAMLEKLLSEQKKELESIEDEQTRYDALKSFEEQQNQLVVGVPLQDRLLSYNPPPLEMFRNVFQDIWRTLHSLFMGYLHPKWLAGPIGIVQIIHYGWTVGLKEAIFWLAVISLNLGVLNLLPIPVLDGGHICMALFEMVTKVRLKAKTMERLILPFVVLLMGFFVFITFKDLQRLFGQFF